MTTLAHTTNIADSRMDFDSLPVAPPTGGRPRARTCVAWLILMMVTLAAHGRSLTDGLFLDDHHHRRTLRSIGWSPKELLDAATIEPSRFADLWWQDEPARWQYSRPFSIAFLKGIYLVSGDDPRAPHLVSLAMHFVTACLVFQLCRRLTASWFWALVGGLLFVVYSHSVFAVGWLAAQNTVLQTMLSLAALLCYIRASGLRVGPSPSSSPPRPSSSLKPAACSLLSAPALSRGWFAATLLLWLLAILSRENALVVPLIFLAFDFAFGGRQHAWTRRGVHAVMLGTALAFFVWRMGFYYFPMPDLYARRPGGEGYAQWWIAKLLHYLCSAIWLSPMVVGPTGRLKPFTDSAGDYWLAGAIIAVMGLGYYVACRNARGWWIWPAWLVLAILPVVHILPTPHQGYFCGVAFAVAMVLGPGLSRHVKPLARARCARWVAAWFLFATCLYIPIYRTLWEGMIAAERYTLAQLETEPSPARGTDVFFLNLPFVNIYAQTCLREAWKLDDRDLRCHILTFAPNAIRVEAPCRIEQVDDRRFTVEIEEGRFFSGVLGRFLIEGLRGGRPIHREVVYEHDSFAARVVDADAGGVRKIEFAFRRPLDDEGRRFYVCTTDNPALRVRFRRGVVAGDGPALAAVLEPATSSLLPPAELDAIRATRDSIYTVISVTSRIIRSDLYMTGPPFDGPAFPWPG